MQTVVFGNGSFLGKARLVEDIGYLGKDNRKFTNAAFASSPELLLCVEGIDEMGDRTAKIVTYGDPDRSKIEADKFEDLIDWLKWSDILTVWFGKQQEAKTPWT